LSNPNQRSRWQQIKERNQIRIRQMNAAMRGWAAKGRLVCRAMDVNVAVMRIDIATAI
jgi:hypothetical protein